MNTMTLYNLEKKKYNYIPFSKPFEEAFGKREKGGIWIIYGKSGHGKTRFVMDLAKEFDRMGYNVLFAVLEMGFCSDLKQMLTDCGISSKTNDIQFTDSLTTNDIEEQLKKQRSADVVIVDSLQYFVDQQGATDEDIIDLRKRYRKRIFVYVSHVEGREVEGKAAYHVKRDSFVRIQVEGFRAIYKGRGKGGSRGYYTIWEEGASNYWLQNDKNYENNSNKENDQPEDGGTAARDVPSAGTGERGLQGYDL